jgi:hypothetical protein
MIKMILFFMVMIPFLLIGFICSFVWYSLTTGFFAGSTIFENLGTSMAQNVEKYTANKAARKS